jgi:hypothetical protein
MIHHCNASYYATYGSLDYFVIRVCMYHEMIQWFTCIVLYCAAQHWIMILNFWDFICLRLVFAWILTWSNESVLRNIAPKRIQNSVPVQQVLIDRVQLWQVKKFNTSAVGSDKVMEVPFNLCVYLNISTILLLLKLLSLSTKKCV